MIKEMKEDLFIDVTTIGREFMIVKNWTTRRFLVLKQSTRLKRLQDMILELRHRDKTRMP
jgi:hypothetical protein